ncbi:uncharacterized protein LOC132169770 [Corylus avellana]|uniref:uncharacterized protein LOC132169770 n=1 Tax=Corylus avellana TaxID=13451 RepID=UPI00286A16CD|nr:uncharacterized protein LOC132169770 [Corylus avellana]
MPLAKPEDSFQQATQAVDLWHLGKGETVSQESVDVNPNSSSWKHPPLGWVKANWDAGVNHQIGCVDLGVVIRDHQGRMWVAKSVTRRGFLEPTAAEFLAASMATRLCTEMGFMRVQMEGDAKVVVDSVNSKLPDESANGHLTDDLHVALSSISLWELGHIGRAGNHVAYELARMALQTEMDKVWLYDPPDCIREILHAEALALQ